jgi:diaminohydroxyphosphoribosylaminopyrimidine deaminase/5-amino-6-(5-phosphoribosylamino)uracil reductase
MFSSADHQHMTQALRLAEKGLFSTSPNPRVGCVVVRDGVVVGEGWHKRAGLPHAEVNALHAAGERARGATAYVTLEPCSHHGRTPPCADALIAGIRVESGLLEDAARELNIGFVSRMTRGRPWVRAKTASSLDGKTALANGVSQWITGPEARRDVHRLRARSCAVLTGIGTVLADDPQMNVRDVDTPRQPLRIVLDSALRMPPQAKMLASGKTLIVTASSDRERTVRLEDAGAEVLVLPGAPGKIDLAQLMQVLAVREINELMVEAGCTLNGALLQAGVVDELVMYVAPILLGDTARGLFGLPELTDMAGRREVRIVDTRMVGKDSRVTARLG